MEVTILTNTFNQKLINKKLYNVKIQKTVSWDPYVIVLCTSLDGTVKHEGCHK